MQKLRPSNGPGASLDQDGDADESRPQSSLLPAPDGQVRQQQQNFWLRRTILMAFSFLFMACALALIGVSRHITAQNGLPLSLSSSSYSWTYGPTGVLVLILALWRQVDYNCRAMQPWLGMAQEPLTAARSVLLDYVSPFQPMACFSALRNGHYAVFISILSFLVLKLIILLSTTLFVVEPTWHLEPVSFRHQNAFNTEHMWNSPDNLTGDWSDIRDHSRQGDVTVWSYLATLNNASANSLSDMDAENVTYQSLIPPEFSSNISSVSAAVDVFVPNVNCEEASLSLSTTISTNDDNYLYYRFDSASCSADNLKAMFLICMDSCKSTERYYSIHWVDCASRHQDNKRSSELSEPDIRYAITIADLATTFKNTSYDSVAIQQASVSICKVGYGMVSANTTLDTVSGRASLSENPVLGSSSRHLPNMTNHDFAEILLANLHVASDTLLVDPIIDKKDISEYAFSFFQLLAAQLKLTGEDLDSLFQAPILRKLSTAAFVGISVQFAKKALLVEDSAGEPFEAAAHISENRLHLRHYTLWPIVSGFFILSTLCVLLFVINPAGVGYLSFAGSGSIASHASVLVNSSSLRAILKDTGYYRSSQLRRKLETLHFIVNPSKYGPRIEIFGSTREALPLEGRHKKRRWLPLSARLPMVVLGFVLPILIFVLLEILQRLSDTRHGLLDLDSSNSATLAYAVRLTSTLLAFLVATLLNNLDFSIAVFTPFSCLRSGNVTAQKSILFHLLGVSPFFILVDTLRLRHFGSAASNLSTFLASFLTIVVSGLWIMGKPTPTLSVSTATVQNWNASWLTKSHDDQGASIALNIIRHGGAATPSSIQGYDVLPIISLGATQSLDRANTTYETTVLRPVLDCDAVPTEEILVETTIRTVSAGKMGAWAQVADILITFNQTVSSGCSPNSSGIADAGDLVVDFKVVDIKGTDLNGIGIGQYWDLDTTPGRSDAACPSTAILFGTLGGTRGNGPKTGNNFTALFCSQRIEEVPATITYRGNPSNIDIDDILVHPGRARSWTNGTKNSKNLAFKLKGFLDSGLTKFPVPLHNKIADGRYYDVFFNHIIFGPRGTLPTDMLGSSNVNALTEAIIHSFKEYLAHVIDLNFRSKDSETSLQGTSLKTTTRLAMHKVSKIILQSLLAATTILSFVGYRLVKIRGTLPRNPCSIASTMGFLADSQLCDPKSGILPKDASLMTERELRQSLHGFVFSLGWWDRSKDSNNSRPASPSGEDSSDLGARNQQEVSESTYFGIDVGHTNALGFSKKEQ